MANQSVEPESISLEIVEKVAKAEGVSPVELTPPLHQTIDPEALETLCRGTDCSIEFMYLDYLVKVDDVDGVTVEKPPTRAG
jgi:hypothetical protein